MAALKTLLYLLVYPGLIFLFVYSTFCEWFDRKIYARLQNRMGPTHTGRCRRLRIRAWRISARSGSACR